MSFSYVTAKKSQKSDVSHWLVSNEPTTETIICPAGLIARKKLKISLTSSTRKEIRIQYLKKKIERYENLPKKETS